MHGSRSKIPSKRTVWGSNPGRGKIFSSSLQRPETLWDRTCLVSISFPGVKLLGPGVNHSFPSYLHLVLGLRMSGVVPLIPPDALIAWTGGTLLCFFFCWFKLRCFRRSRNNQHYALICTSPLFYILAPTCFGSSLPSSGSFLDPSVLLEIQDPIYSIKEWYKSVYSVGYFYCVLIITARTLNYPVSAYSPCHKSHCAMGTVVDTH
jgi:hypothetical protein